MIESHKPQVVLLVRTANLVNEAALLAARNKQTEVLQADLNEAIERVVAGLEKKSRVLQDDEKKVVAYHEVGHAIVGHLMPEGSLLRFLLFLAVWYRWDTPFRPSVF